MMNNTPLRPLAAAIFLTALVGGCSLAPQYLRPSAPVAETYQNGNEGKARPAGEIGWREFFPDRRLQLLISTALEHNRDLKSAVLRIEEARALYDIQSAERLPGLNGSAGVGRGRTPGTLTTGKPAVGSRYDVGVGMPSFELDFFGRVKSLNNAALALYLASEEARQAAHIGLVAEVAKAYLAVLAFAEQADLAQKTLDGRGKSFDLAKRRFEVGASSELDLRLADSSLHAARVAVLALTRQQDQSRNALTLLVGKPLTELPMPSTSTATLSAQTIISDIPPGLPSDLLARRPDIRAAEQRLRAANANIGAARAAFFPRISLTAGFGTASNALSGLFDSGSGTWSFAPQIVLPIFDAGRNANNLRLSEVHKNLAINEYEKAIQVAFREVADALAARNLLEQQIAAQRGVLDAQTQRLKLSNLRQQNGIASALDVLDAERELFTAEQALVQVKLLRLSNAIDLYRALGGGLSGLPTS